MCREKLEKKTNFSPPEEMGLLSGAAHLTNIFEKAKGFQL